MPRLRAFGKEWAVGSDDAAIPAAIDAIVTGSWLGSFTYIYLKNRHSFGCTGNHVMHTFYLSGVTIAAVQLLLMAGIVRCSLKGTLINWTPRKNLQNWLAARLVWQAVSTLFSVQAVRWSYYTNYECSDAIVSTMKTAARHVVSGSLISGFTLFAMTRRPVKKDRHHGHPSMTNIELLHELEVLHEETSFSVFHFIRSRYRNLKYFLLKIFKLQPDPTLAKVSQFFSTYFEDDLDLVPSDILMALMILAQRQDDNRRSRTFSHQDMMDGAVHCIQPKPWMKDLSLHSHYFKFSYGIYGWWPYFVMSERGALWNLFKIVIKGRYIPRGLPPFITGDNRLLANTTALQILTKLPMEDLVFVSFVNERFELPFFIALDHKTESIVVTIRGSLSVEDAIVDLYCFSEPLPNEKGEVHAGMLESALVLKDKLLVKNEGSSFENGRPLLEVAREKLVKKVGREKAEGYGLVITGHSLGAGTAGVLSILMKNEPGCENLRCFAFSPPGGLMSPEAAREAEDFICSVVLGDDIVGRLGLTQVYGFKAKILKIIKTCDIPKHEIFGDWLESTLSTLLRVKRRKQNKCDRDSWEGDPEAEQQVKEFQSHIEDAYEEAVKEKHNVSLQPPGCVIFITVKQSSIFSIFGQKSTYDAYFTPCSSKMFNKLILRPEIIRHHLPWEVMRALDGLSADGKQPLLKQD